MKDMQKNRIAGALYGVAVGDALGGPVEFMERDNIARWHGRITDMIGGGWLSLRPGEITDDTQMTLCVAEGIAEAPEAPIQAIGRRFIEWANSDPKDIGCACAFSIYTAQKVAAKRNREAPTAKEWERGITEIQRLQARPIEGNGALMRTVYPGLYYGNDAAQAWAAKIARMTHSGPRSTEACILYSDMVNLLTESRSIFQDTQSPREFLTEQCWGIPEYIAAEETPIVTPADGGYVVDSMRIAVGCIANTDSFEGAVVKAVNLGGDTDTNGAITGGLAGAWYGYDAIPERWINALDQDIRATINRLVNAATEARRG